jgi:hypothetical protein
MVLHATKWQLCLLIFALLILVHDAFRPTSIKLGVRLHGATSSLRLSSSAVPETAASGHNTDETISQEEATIMCRKLDKEIGNVAIPAFFSLTADPLASLVDAMYIGRLTAADQVLTYFMLSSCIIIFLIYTTGRNGYRYQCAV